MRRCETGLGLFAVRRQPADRLVLEYTGPRLSEEEAIERGGRYLVELNDGTYVDGSGRDNLARYINHSCRPNCSYDTPRHRVWIRTLRVIAPGEELTCDYGEEYVARWFARSGCLCDACRDGGGRKSSDL